jgi:acyl carrier protein
MINQNNSKVKSILKNYIMEDILLGDRSFEIDDDTALVNDNIIDSINLMKLISFIEKKMNITYDHDDYSVDNFNTINDIVELINKKCKE